MIRHIHLNDCDSTQDILKEQLNNPDSNEAILVSCENQISGRGRGENKWISLPETLCFSLNINPHSELSFTALELSVIIARFFESNGRKLKLKWPNDLLNENNQKCGGVLIQGSKNQLCAGIGINLSSSHETYGGVFDEKFEINKKTWAKEITDFIHSHRYESTAKLTSDWLGRCGHLNQMVTVTEGNTKFEGIFQSLGAHGEALICTDGKIQSIYNGTLRINP
jgi:BirA family transcriptional regulator, biotin operon repressor / biotin---[acetyl-CoA-carboxylase] ligase